MLQSPPPPNPQNDKKEIHNHARKQKGVPSMNWKSEEHRRQETTLPTEVEC